MSARDYLLALPSRHKIDQSNEFREALPKSIKAPNADFDGRHILRAGLPHATIGVFHIHPNITHGAARDDFQNGIMPPVTTYQCNAITGKANRSANTYSRLQWVYNPECGLMNHITQTYQDTWNATMGMHDDIRIWMGGRQTSNIDSGNQRLTDEKKTMQDNTSLIIMSHPQRLQALPTKCFRMAHVIPIHTARSWSIPEADPKARNAILREPRNSTRGRRRTLGEVPGDTTRLMAMTNKDGRARFFDLA